MAATSTITQQYALKWNNFYSNLSSGFHDLFEAAELVDVTLAVDGKFLQAHKLVLSICSPYFKELFKMNPCKHPIVILKDVGHEHMKNILEFMYLGEVSVLRENLESFLKTAELLQVKGLTGDDSSDSSSKEDEKFECENEDEEEYSSMMHNIHYAQQYNCSMENHHNVPQNYSNSAMSNTTTPTTTQPLSMHNINVPQSPNNNKRYQKNSNSTIGGKRTKIDNNANQSIIQNPIINTMPMPFNEMMNVKKNLNQENDDECTTVTENIMKPKSEQRTIKNEEFNNEQTSTETKTVSTHENTVIDQDMFMFSVDSKPCVYCPYCERKFVNRYNLKVHIRDKHEDSATNLDCDVCGKTMRNRSCLRVHMYHHRKQVEQPDNTNQ